MTAPELLRQTSADPPERQLGFPGQSEPAPDSDYGNRSKALFLHSVRPNKLAGQNPPIRLLMLALGFTLVELLIVIAIIGALVAIAIPNYYKSIEKAQMTKIITEMKMLEKEILSYQIENEAYPDSLADIGRDGFLDPWGNPYEYLSIETGSGNGQRRKSGSQVPINTDFDLYSVGPDGKSVSALTSANSYDDIVRGSNGAFFGPAWAY